MAMDEGAGPKIDSAGPDFRAEFCENGRLEFCRSLKLSLLNVPLLGRYSKVILEKIMAGRGGCHYMRPERPRKLLGVKMILEKYVPVEPR